VTPKIRKRTLASVALAGAAGLLLSACAAPPEEGDGPAEGSDFLACAVSDEGSWNDKSFNEAAYEGLLMAEEELGVEIADAESNTEEDFTPNLNQMVEAGCDVTFAVGFNFQNGGIIFDVADENPDAQFVWIDGWNEGQSNLKPITYQMDESSFLAGYLAAAYSTSKVLGTYGGGDGTLDSVSIFMDGFYTGAKHWEEENGTPVTVVGWDPTARTGDFVGDFANSGVAKSITEGQLAAGADVIFPVAGGLFTASAEAIREASADAVIIGVDKDIALTQPDYADLILTSVEKRMTQAVFDVIGSLADGDEFEVEPYVGTLENDGTALSEFYDFDAEIPADLKAKLEELKAGIIDGSIDASTVY
jgi:basic membrane protein A